MRRKNYSQSYHLDKLYKKTVFFSPLIPCPKGNTVKKGANSSHFLTVQLYIYIYINVCVHIYIFFLNNRGFSFLLRFSSFYLDFPYQHIEFFLLKNSHKVFDILQSLLCSVYSSKHFISIN